MTADPRDMVSESTEIDERLLNPHFAALLRAVLWGATAGGSVFLLFTVPVGIIALAQGEVLLGLGIALLPLGISGAGTLAGMLLVGLPLTAYLHRHQRETERAYSRGGLFAGLLLPAAFLAVNMASKDEILVGGVFFGIFGMIAGGVAGQVWGNWRVSCAAAAAHYAAPPANPFHDMIH